MLKEIGIFYNNYEGKKCSYSTYNKRVKYGYTYEEAVYKGSLKRKQNHITDDGRTCNNCKTYKTYFHFTKNRTICKVCARIKAGEFYLKNKDKINKSKKEKRNTQLGKLKSKFDKVFYSDPNIQKIIQIEGRQVRIKQANKGEIKKDKYLYFLNRGYTREFLTRLYGNILYVGKTDIDNF